MPIHIIEIQSVFRILKNTEKREIVRVHKQLDPVWVSLYQEDETS